MTASVVFTLKGGLAQADERPMVWAVNVGGPAYQATDGTAYEAESSLSGGITGTLDHVKGSQDPVLYETFREGALRVERPVPNGRYDITFHFAEHEPIGGGERVFDVLVEDRVVIRALDVMRSRDGIDDDIFPQRMLVDYVRVYRLEP
ncbi:malectin domain-containing carbohydrate-binding protein [Wenzhouxiangella sp. XN24]|uniref:malectin domain-containing carbohydrate-binding protein n=1 Tax=Wenzhouxiangella sp. XN24 TaxID=2713569 RepID=UPI0013EE27A0|nr:malectin domain-containing carbohydrate-binding protein [Wenzhouxiangella sp. XN24]NGX16262.1 hypothetical protein [Wenzhouxiangella sp. XN24]